jgi:hypothetical protein
MIVEKIYMRMKFDKKKKDCIKKKGALLYMNNEVS